MSQAQETNGIATHASTAHEERWLHGVLVLLTVATGMVDAASYLGMGRVFTANMTGNVVLLGFAIAHAPGLSVGHALAALGAALLGGVTGGRLRQAFAKWERRHWLTTAIAIEMVLLSVAALLAWRYGGNVPPVAEPVLFALIVLTGVAMGLRNATVRALAVADITTTVLTLTIAGLASESSLAGGANPRVGRRVAAVLAMLAGAWGGAVLLRYGLAWVLAAAAILNLAAASLYHVKGAGSLQAEPPA